MRRLLLATAAILMASAAPTLAQDVKDSNSILQELKPHPAAAPAPATAAPADDGSAADGAVVVKKSRGIKHAAGPAAEKPASSLIVLFASGSADLTDAGRAQLDQVGAALKDPSLSGMHFRIEGHTDTTGDAQTNKALSARRAAAVVNYLASQYGLDRGKFVAVGMGKDGLAVPTPDQTDEPRNRRVVLINLDG